VIPSQPRSSRMKLFPVITSSVAFVASSFAGAPDLSKVASQTDLEKVIAATSDAGLK
jgi:hypothetical protein